MSNVMEQKMTRLHYIKMLIVVVMVRGRGRRLSQLLAVLGSFFVMRCCLLILALTPSCLLAEGGDDSWATRARQEQLSWRYSKEGDTYPPAESPPARGVPTQYHEFAGMFKPYIGLEYDLRDIFITGERIFLHEKLMKAFQLVYQRQGNRPVPSAIKDLLVPLVALVDELEVSNFRYWAEHRPTLPPTPPPSEKAILLEALRVVGLLDRVYHRAIFDWPRENVIASTRALTSQFFTRLRSHRGASLTDIFVLSILATPSLAEQVLIYPQEVGFRLVASQADQLLGNKTTPSLAYNNQVAAITSQRIPWKDLGMQHYNGFKGFFPWATMGLAENYYTHREMWELAEFTPVIGTMLSLADGLVTMYEGKDYYGASSNRVWTGAFLALDTVDLVFTGGTLGAAAVKPAKFAKLSLLTKELKLAKFPKTREGSLLMLNKLRRILSEAMTSPGVGEVCRILRVASPAAARGRLDSDLQRSSDFAENGVAAAVALNSKCIRGAISTSQNMVLDTNLLVPLVIWKKYAQDIVERLNELYPRREALSPVESKSYFALLRAYITGKLLEGDYVAKGHSLVLVDKVLTESEGQFLKDISDLKLAGVREDPKLFETALNEYIDRNRTIQIKPVQITGTNGAQDLRNVLTKFGVGDEPDSLKGIHKGEADREILFDTLVGDREGYAQIVDPRVAVKPFFMTNDRHTFASAVLLGRGSRPGLVPNLWDKSQYKEFANGHFKDVGGLQVVLSEQNVVLAINDQIKVGNQHVLSKVPAPIRNLTEINGRDIENLPMKARLVPCNCSELKTALAGLPNDHSSRPLYQRVLDEVNSGVFTED